MLDGLRFTGGRAMRSAFALTAALAASVAGRDALGGGTDLHIYSEPAESLFGWGVAGLGDVNLDGKPDFAIGAKGAAAPGLFSAGSLSVYSGADGTLLYRIRGDLSAQGLGTSIAPLADLDNDGRVDFVVGAPSTQGSVQPPGHVRVCSGLDGSEIRRVNGSNNVERFGDVVVNVGDLNADGKPDFAVGAPGVTGATQGSCRVFSSADGSEFLALRQTGPTFQSNLGHGIAALGDVNADGTPDFAVSAPASDPKRQNRLHIGEVIVVSGADGSLVRRHAGKKIGDRFGHSIAPAGDQDGDGTTDLLVGSIGVKGVGEVTLWSGKTGKRLVALRGIVPGGRFGIGVAALGDVDGDGRDELVVGGQADSSGEVIVIGTKSRKPIYLYRGAPDEIAGDFIAAIADVNADQRPDLLIGGWGGDVARVVSVDATPLALPLPLSLKATFQVPAAASGPQSGSLAMKVKGVLQTLTFKWKGLPPATSFYSLQLEDAPGAGTYRRIAVVSVVNGKATVVLSAQYLPPGPLGVSTLAQLSGRRIELRDGTNVVLELTVN